MTAERRIISPDSTDSTTGKPETGLPARLATSRFDPIDLAAVPRSTATRVTIESARSAQQSPLPQQKDVRDTLCGQRQ